MANDSRPKEVDEIKPECCITCNYLLTCAEVAGAKCRNYRAAEIDKTALSARYLETIQKIAESVKELQSLELELKIAEKTKNIPKEKVKVEEKIAIPEGITEEQFLKMLEDTKTTPEEWEQLPTNAKENIVKAMRREVQEPEEKPAISRRNKQIIELIEQGKGVKEIAEELKLKPETVEKELEYLLKLGMIKAHPS